MREAKRVLLAPALWGLLAFLLIFNIMLAVTQDWHTKDFYRAYQSTLRTYRAIPVEEAVARAEAEREKLNALGTLELYQSTDDAEFKSILREELAFSYGTDFAHAILSGVTPRMRVQRGQYMEIMDVLLAQLTHLRDYPAYLLQVQNNVQTMKALAIFNKEGGFSARNIEKTGRDFPTEVELRLDTDFAVTALVTDSLGGYSLLVFTLFLTLQFLVERKRGLWSLVHGTPEGRQRLAVRRGGLLLLGVAIGTLVLLGGKLIFYAIHYCGLGSLTRNVQSLAVFDDFPWVMPVWVFLLGYFLLKILGMWLVGLAVWAILQSVNHLPLALCTAGFVLATEYALFRFIPDSYVIVFLRYVNLFALVDVPQIALHYLNLNFFGWPVQGFLLSVGLIPLMLGLLLGANVLLAARKKPVSRQNSLLAVVDRVRVPFSRFVSRLRLLGLELYKLLWLQKGLLIVLLVGLFSFGVQELQWPDGHLYERELAGYSASMQGPITEQTLRELDEKIGVYSAYPPSEQILGQLQILQQLRALCADSLEKQDGRWLIAPEPYAALMGFHEESGQSYQRQIAVVLLLALVLVLHGVFSQEHQSRVTQLLQGTPRGGAVLWRKKLAVTLLVTVLIWLVFEAGELWHISREYEGLALAAPAQSFEYFAELPWRVSLGAVAASYLLLRLLAMLAAAGVILLISCCCRQNNLSLLASCAVLVLPACLSYMRMDLLDGISLNRLFSPLEGSVAGYTAAAAVGLACLVASRLRWRSRSKART